MERTHRYSVGITWTGNRGEGTKDYRGYSRDHVISGNGKPEIAASSDPAFRGDPARYNPEELLLSSLAACHLLWYLHCCSETGVVVTGYKDQPVGTMTESGTGGGQFTEVTLFPGVIVEKKSMIPAAMAAHEKAHALCYIARSVNFPVRHQPTCTAAGDA